MSEDIKLWASQMETENIEEEEHLANKPVSVARSKKPSFNRGDPNDPQLIQTTTSGKNSTKLLLIFYYRVWGTIIQTMERECNRDTHTYIYIYIYIEELTGIDEARI